MPKLEKWSLRRFMNFCPPEEAFCFFGEVYNDHRHNPETGEFADGHRIITGPVQFMNLKEGIAKTFNTTYDLGKIDAEFGQWLERNNFTLQMYEEALEPSITH